MDNAPALEVAFFEALIDTGSLEDDHVLGLEDRGLQRNHGDGGLGGVRVGLVRMLDNAREGNRPEGGRQRGPSCGSVSCITGPANCISALIRDLLPVEALTTTNLSAIMRS